jgi:CDP-glycerol glycerophosphotransferase
LLLRGHSNTPGFSDAQRYSNVRDVSRYPDIGDLLEIADVLVTDYSSVMFDFAVTGRPILFLTPDLAEYGSSTRGFYLDFEGIAPGPLLGTTEDVLDALDSTGTITEQYRDRYTQFQRTFKRVVDAVWSTER